MNAETATALRAPFPAEQIGKLPRIVCPDCSKARGKCCDSHSKSKCAECGNYITERHIHLDYVGHADVTSRLIEVDPDWTWEPAAVDGHGLPLCDVDDSGSAVGLWIKLTVAGVTRLGYGSCGSDQSDAVKVLIGDALRNAAMRFGVAVDLWAKGDRADPTAENSTTAPAAARRRTPEKAKPAPITDLAWMETFDGRIVQAVSVDEVRGLWTEAAEKHSQGLLTDEDHELLKKAMTVRSDELKPTP